MSNRVKSEMKGLTKREQEHRMSWGLAMARRHAKLGVPMRLEVLATFCGTTDSTIARIEKRALRKLRHQLMEGDERLRAVVEQAFGRAKAEGPRITRMTRKGGG